MDVIFTRRARGHLRSLKAYISKQSYPSRADAYTARILDYCEGLSTFPMRGTKRDDIIDGLRLIGFERSATIAFVVTENQVIIEGVFYRGRSVEKQLKGKR